MVEVAKRYIARRPDEEMIYFTLGGALAALDRLDEAAEAFREALRVEPNPIPASENREWALREAERIRLAASVQPGEKIEP